MSIQEIDLDLIYNNPYQKRHNYEEITSLARTIAQDDLQQMPKARPHQDGVQLKFGHRRTHAFRWLRENWEKENLRNRYNGYTVMPLDVADYDDEEMFRGATVENSQRGDLSPIERMEEMKAWVEFGYSSKQIADLYPGMSDSTVRGFLHFDQLAPEAKTALHEGKITQGTARTLLSMQKIASDEVMRETLSTVIVGKDRWDDDALPDDLIVAAIDDLENVKEFFDEARGGKPRANGDDGWLLDMKNFPNHLLPILTVEDYTSEFDLLPEGANNKRVWNCIRSAKDPADLIAMWKNSDFEEDHARAETLARLFNPPACTACPTYTKLKGTHYCGDKVCFFRKVSAWKRQTLHTASKKLGIAIYTEADGNYLVLEDTYQNQKHAELYKKRNKDLRLVFMEDIERKKYQSGYEGCPNGSIVIVVGDTLKKLLEVKQEEKQTVKKDTARVRRNLFSKKIDALLWEATLYLKPVLDGLSDALVEGLYNAPRFSWAKQSAVPEIETDDEAELALHMRREIALHILLNSENGIDVDVDDEDSTAAAAAGEIVSCAKKWEIKIPASFLKLAEEMDAEIAAAVVVETADKKS